MPITVECRAPLGDGGYCGHRWQARVQNLLSGYGCPKCYHRSVSARAIPVETLNQWLPAYGLHALGRAGQIVQLRCPSGHRFRMRFHLVQQLRQRAATTAVRREVCPECKRRLAYYRHRREVTGSGLILDVPLEEWKGRVRRYTYRCAADPSHTHQLVPGQMRWRRGCPSCRKETGQQALLAGVETLVRERGGELLPGQTYATCDQKLACRCADGHRFRISRDKLLQGGWCPTCSTRFGERLAVFVMEHIFGALFPKARPPFLINDQTGKRLEFDGFNARLGIAVEHQGLQHARLTRGWHRSPEDHQAMRARDDRKRALARAHGVRLVEVPQLDAGLSVAEVLERVECACRAAGVAVPSYDRDLDIAPVFRGSSNQLRLEHLVRAKGGQLLDPYQGLRRKVRLSCANPAHPPWAVTPFSVLYQETWCPRCGDEVIGRKVRERHVARVMAWLAAESAQLLDGPYRGLVHRHHWGCAAGHVVVAHFRTLDTRRRAGKQWCRFCRRGGGTTAD